jgi:hypothetical protein
MVAIPGGAVKAGDMEQGGTPLPEATYTFRIDKIEIKTAKGVGKFPYLNLELTCIDGGSDEHLGRKVWDIVTLKPGARQKLRGLLEEGLGWSEDQEFEDTEQLEQQEVRAAITIEEGQPRDERDPSKGRYPDRNKVVKYLPRG